MSIYATTSDSYWKKSHKKNDSKSPFLIASVVIFALVAFSCSILHIQNRRSPTTKILTQRRSLHEATDIQWRECESRVNSRQQCTSICQPERNSIQRKTMLQACLHGCQTAHEASTALGCRGQDTSTPSSSSSKRELSEEDVFQEIGVLAFDHCSKFQGVDPKPNVFATCRKYHRAGTKQGFRMGMSAMNDVLDEEWAGIKAEQ